MANVEFFGLDIGNHSVKLAQVSRAGDTVTLEKIGGVNSDGGILNDDSDQGIKNLAEKIKQARIEAGITTVNCVAAVPESPVFSRLLTVPKVTDDELSETIHWEIKPLIPVSIEEVDIAFLEIGEKQVGEQTLLDIYAVAAPKSLTEKFKQLAEYAGINLIALETESLANTRITTFNHETETDIMICDLGAKGTDLILARNGIPVFAQTINTGSDAFTRAVAADYGIDLGQAEKYKRSYGLLRDQGEGKIAKSIDPIIQIVTSEMERMMAYFSQQTGSSSARSLYLCGDAAQLPGLTDHFKTTLNLQTTSLVDPIAKLKLAGSVESKVAQLSSVGYSVALGLALKEH